jgi:hypothetical protein
LPLSNKDLVFLLAGQLSLVSLLVDRAMIQNNTQNIIKGVKEMLKQFRMKKVLAILLAVLFVTSLTAVAVSARGGGHGGWGGGHGGWGGGHGGYGNGYGGYGGWGGGGWGGYGGYGGWGGYGGYGGWGYGFGYPWYGSYGYGIGYGGCGSYII